MISLSQIIQRVNGMRVPVPRTREKEKEKEKEKLSFYAANKRGDSCCITGDRQEQSAIATCAPLQMDSRRGVPYTDNNCCGTDEDYAYVTEINCNGRDGDEGGGEGGGEGGKEPVQRFQRLWDHILNC